MEVRGRLSGNVIDSSLVAIAPENRTSVVSGTLLVVPPRAPVGTWTVRLDDGGDMSFAVESAAVVDTRSAPAVPGIHVRAVLEDDGAGRWTALEVQTDWPE